MTKLFSADGASGRAIKELSCELMIKAGRALALVISRKKEGKPKIIVGRDTRISGEILSLAFAAGCCSAGADCHILGIIPTAGVSDLCRKYSADAGIMITAAHNSYEYNGIVLFDGTGDRLSDSIAEEAEKLVWEKNAEKDCPGGENIGNIVYEKNAEWDYVRGLMKRIEGDLNRMRIVVDCANGAAFTCAEKFFRGIGASVFLIGSNPDGKNINSGCGAFEPEELSKSVLEHRAHIGIALDGDGGRCILCDEQGNILGGDRIIAILSEYMKREQKLSANTCVVSQTTNLAFFRWAKENGIVSSQAPEVGLRHILERMKTGDYNLGGSASGHVVVRPSKTADGLLTGALVAEIMSKYHKKLSELASGYQPYPSFKININLRPEYCSRWADVPALKEIISYCQQKLEGDGRVLVRESAVSPILRILAEGRNKDVVWQYAQAIAKTATDYVGLEEETEDENG